MKWRLALPSLLALAAVPAQEASAFDLGLTQQKVEWNGEVETGANTYKGTPPQQDTAQEAVVRAHLRPKLNLEEKSGLKMDILFRADAGNATRDTVRIDEAFVFDRVSDSLTLRAGKIIYGWGNDALFNPTDFINPRDYYDFCHVDKLGVIALDANYLASPWLSFDFGIIPVFQPSIVSDPTSRWINYTPFASAAVVSQLGLPGNLPAGYTVPFDLQNRNPKYPQVFARMNLKTLRFDASLAYSYRYNPYPQVVLFSSDVRVDAINGVPIGQIQGVPYYQHEHLLALDTNVPVLGSVFFFNSTLSIPDVTQSDIPSNDAILSNFHNAGLGSHVTSSDIDNARKSSTAIVTLGVRKDWSKFHAYVQYAKIWYLQGSTPTALLGQVTGGAGVNPADFYDFFSGTLIPGFSWDLSRRLALRTGTILNFRNTGGMADVGLDYRITDGFRATLAVDYLNGKDGSLLKYYSDNSRVGLTLDMVF
jgi:hypothetical protein